MNPRQGKWQTTASNTESKRAHGKERDISCILGVLQIISQGVVYQFAIVKTFILDKEIKSDIQRLMSSILGNREHA